VAAGRANAWSGLGRVAASSRAQNLRTASFQLGMV
jgi:hypothetical protein